MSTCGSEFLNLVNNILKPLSRFRELGIAVFRGFTNLRILLILNCVYNANNVFLYAGLMMWYQMFEYAIGHWLQKATEHMIGCVLCSPGCFSLFRGNFVFSSGNIFIGHQRVSSVTCNTEDFHCLFFPLSRFLTLIPFFSLQEKLSWTTTLWQNTPRSPARPVTTYNTIRVSVRNESCGWLVRSVRRENETLVLVITALLSALVYLPRR